MDETKGWAPIALVGAESDDATIERLEETFSQFDEVMTSMRRTDDGGYTSHLGPVEISADEDADTAGCGEAELGRVCWDDGVYPRCCEASRCCFHDEGAWYCG